MFCGGSRRHNVNDVRLKSSRCWRNSMRPAYLATLSPSVWWHDQAQPCPSPQLVFLGTTDAPSITWTKKRPTLFFCSVSQDVIVTCTSHHFVSLSMVPLHSHHFATLLLKFLKFFSDKRILLGVEIDSNSARGNARISQKVEGDSIRSASWSKNKVMPFFDCLLYTWFIIHFETTWLDIQWPRYECNWDWLFGCLWLLGCR